MEQPQKKETCTVRSLKIFTLVFFWFTSFEHLAHLQGTRFPRLGGEGYSWVGRVGVGSQGGLVDWLPHEHETRGFKVHLVENSNKTDVFHKTFVSSVCEILRLRPSKAVVE